MINIEQTGSQYTATWNYFSSYFYAKLTFLVPWTAVCVYMTYNLFILQHQATALITLVLWGFWFRPFIDTVNMLFGKTRLVFDEKGFHTLYTCLNFKREKQIALIEISRFETHYHYWQAYLQVVYNNGKKYRCTASSVTPKKELDDMCRQLNVFMETQKSSL